MEESKIKTYKPRCKLIDDCFYIISTRNKNKNLSVPEFEKEEDSINKNQNQTFNDNDGSLTLSQTDSTHDTSTKKCIYKKTINHRKIKMKPCKFSKIKENNKTIVVNNDIDNKQKNRNLFHSKSSSGIISFKNKNIKLNDNVITNTYNQRIRNRLTNNIFNPREKLIKNYKINNTNNNINNTSNFSMNNTNKKINNAKSNSIININKNININNINKINNTNYMKYDTKDGYKKEFINIDELMLFEEKFNDVINSIDKDSGVNNQCFDLINYYKESSLCNKFEQYFNNDPQAKIIIHKSVMMIIFNAILTYHISYDREFFLTCRDYLKFIIDYNHKSYLLLCEYISKKIPESSYENIWVKKLLSMLKENLKHLDEKNKNFIQYLTTRGYDIPKKNINFIYEIKFYSNWIQKYVKVLLKNFSDDPLKNNFINFFNDLNIISHEKLHEFFKKKVIKIINKNASFSGCDISQYDEIKPVIEAPYLKNPLTKKFCIVLDLDETLIFLGEDENNKNKGILKFRPGLLQFLSKIKKYYEIIVFTSATKEYGDKIEDIIEKDKKFFDVRLYREHTIIYENELVKDISRIGRPLEKIIIVDNMPQNFRLQKENGINIKAFWGDDQKDNALSALGIILKNIAKNFDDVREGIAFYKDEILNKVSSNFSRKEEFNDNSENIATNQNI